MKVTALQKSMKSENESDFEDSHYNEDSTNFSDDERGRQSAVSAAMQMNGDQLDSDPEESDCASSFESSKLTLKNVENLLDKSATVSVSFNF
jgi:hypothetical protein